MGPIRPPVPETQSRTSLIDRWYRALDYRRITVGTRCWLVLVTGIHVHGNNLWIQISHADNPDESLVLHVKRETSIDSAIAAVCAWAPLDREHRVIHVTPEDSAIIS